MGRSPPIVLVQTHSGADEATLASGLIVEDKVVYNTLGWVKAALGESKPHTSLPISAC